MKPALTLIVSAKFRGFAANMGEGFCFYMGDIFLQGRWWGKRLTGDGAVAQISDSNSSNTTNKNVVRRGKLFFVHEKNPNRYLKGKWLARRKSLLC